MEENKTITFDQIRSTDIRSILPKPSVGIAKTNPFMFDCTKAKDFNVSSIEDFLIVYKRQEMYLGDFIRGPYKKWKKKRIVLKAINNWILEFDDKEEVAEEVTQAKEETRPVLMKRLKIGTYVSLILCTIILFVLAFGKGSAFDKESTNFFVKLLYGWQDVSGDLIPRIALTVGVYTSVVAWIVIFLYRTVCNTFFTITKRINRLQDKMKNSIGNDFRRKSHNTLKYYRRLLRKDNIKECDPLPIEETGVTGYSFDDIQKINEGYDRSALSLKRKKGLLLFLRFVLLWSTYLCTIVISLYGVVMAIISLFNKG